MCERGRSAYRYFVHGYHEYSEQKLPGDPFAQIMFQKKATNVEFEGILEFDDTAERSVGEFGSTDNKCRTEAAKQQIRLPIFLLK